MPVRHTGTLPIPHEDLVGLQEQLAPHYGSQLWQGQGRSILVARVPHDEPDIVNDVEHVVEAAVPSEVEKAEQVLLMAGRKVHAVPADTLKRLMADRVVFDRRQCAEMRTQLPGQLSHCFYRSPEDPARRTRLAVRLPCEFVGDVEDSDLEELADRLGAQLEDGTFDGVHCVYLIASRDEARLETGLFVQDLLPRWRDEARRARVLAEQENRERLERARREADRRRLMMDLEGRYTRRVAYAPVRKKIGETETVLTPRAAAPGHATAASHGPSHVAPALRRVRAQVDALTHRVHEHEAAAPDAMAPAEARAPTGSRALDALADELEAAQYDVMVRPDVPGHTVHLAAERDQEYPQRIIVVEHGRFTVEHAEALLAACKGLDADLALAVADSVDPEAKKRIIATKIKTLRPDETGHLDL